MPDLPTGRYYHGTIVLQDVYIVGGWDNKDLDRYDNISKTFKTKHSLQTGRCNFGICEYDSKHFIIAGGDDDYYTTRTSYLYDVTSNKFKKVGNLNSKRHGHVLVNCMDEIYAIGGSNDDCLNTIEIFDKSTKLWRVIRAKLVIARFYHCAVAHKHFIFVIGGMKQDFKILNSIEKFNTLSGKIELLQIKLRVARSLFALTKLEKSVFIIGGQVKSKKSDKFTGSVEILNLEHEKLYLGKSVPIADKGFCSCVL